MRGTIVVRLRLRPELVGRVGVARMQPRLPQLPVLDVEDLDCVVVQSLSLPFSSRAQKRDGMLVVGQDRVDVELEGSAGQFHVFLEVGEDLILAAEGPGELVASRGVPDDVVGEQLIQSGHVAGGERLVAPADKILVGVSQWFLLALCGQAEDHASSGPAACSSNGTRAVRGYPGPEENDGVGDAVGVALPEGDGGTGWRSDGTSSRWTVRLPDSGDCEMRSYAISRAGVVEVGGRK